MPTPREVKVGAFVFVTLAAIGLVIFLIGDERGLFSPKEDYRAVFDDVGGLQRGSPVHMGGITVGSVASVGYGDDPNDAHLYVTVTVSRDEARRIREDSVASIEPKGFLGDRMISITVGSSDKPRLPPGSVIRSGESGGLTRVLRKVEGLGDKAEQVMINLEATTGALADEQFRSDLQSAVSSLNVILGRLEQGEGYVGRLLTDKQEAHRLSQTMASLEETAAQLEQTATGVNSIVARINHGPGFAHDLIYGEAPTRTLVQFGEAAEEVALTLRGVREGDGLAHSLLYGGDETEDLMGNLTAISADVRHIVADVRHGKGTIGALLVDPSVYEDLKILLGNVERNRTLRALVRYSIRRDERSGGAEVRDSKPSGAAGRKARSSTGPASGGGASNSGP
jgi:phospholipid/cholesterol/gamma-HCH transport system substrate-binding protein